MMGIGTGISFAELLYAPMFDALGVTATLTLADDRQFTFVALDKTIGIALPQAGGLIVETLTPIAELRMADVLAAGLTKDNLTDSSITLNGSAWSVISYRMNPSPSGEADGTVYLQLESMAP